ncbi:MAG: flagellar export chaperone FlgN [Candidatus Latescibacteria bacterium]|nr:flagellar export chaperone FlgN [Candidatus Latescibacterota bacterium]
MTSDLSASLLNVLREELDAYQRLADFLKHQCQLIVQRRIEEMQHSIGEEESLIRQTEQLGAVRSSAALALAQNLGIQSDESPRLSDLLPLLDTTTAADLSHIRENFLRLVDSLNDLIVTNQFLMAHALRLTAKRFAILEGVDDGNIVYAQTGRRDPADQMTMKVIDRKI